MSGIVGGAGCCPGYGGAFTSVGVILVLFILLVIISRAWI
ncbi:sporulation protein YjcZ [Paenibacillus rigui]|uniref:Sporulation protein YjcZ n=1 Tax=Paenibacillus rigui TaxID=554312 RepID=A0A229ULK6_9BACL|nr:sporulation protein YjcZ [Paenibacillus rigui]OXM84357.1 sporulation protein YjcZ [Paenibacillus rigui]